MQKKNENKKNKKVVVVAAMALLLALVGISGGETYAKYASNQTDDATATVAKWGYTVSANATELFGQKYGIAEAGKQTTIQDAGVNVVSSSEKKVVAPGTEGQMTMSVNGDAEVLSQINTTLSITDIVLKTKVGDQVQADYYPITWTLEIDAQFTLKGAQNPTEFNFSSKEYNGIEDGKNVNTRINEDITELNTFFNEIHANSTVEYNLTLSWEWKFDNSMDKWDTIFGGLVNNVATFGTTDVDFGTAATWKIENAVDKNYYVYQYGTKEEEVKYTDSGSVFQTKVAGSVTVSQIQDPVQP